MPQQGYMPPQGYTSQPGYGVQPGYMPQQGMQPVVTQPIMSQPMAGVPVFMGIPQLIYYNIMWGMSSEGATPKRAVRKGCYICRY